MSKLPITIQLSQQEAAETVTALEEYRMLKANSGAKVPEPVRWFYERLFKAWTAAVEAGNTEAAKFVSEVGKLYASSDVVSSVAFQKVVSSHGGERVPGGGVRFPDGSLAKWDDSRQVWFVVRTA